MMPSTRCHRLRPGWALALAIAATSTALCMSVLAGWQRGGWLSERLVWMAIGVVLVVGAHLLPALCRSAPFAVRSVGAALWLGCMAAASYGHATFFLLSQSHAGAFRASMSDLTVVPIHRSLTTVTAERASVTTGLAEADARHCIRDCPALRVRRVSLAARLDALDTETAEIQRLQGIEDGNAERRNAARHDPVTARLASLCGLAIEKLDLLAGLAFAAVLESMACLLWWIALMPDEREPSVTGSRDIVPVETTMSPVTTPAVSPAEPETEVTKLLRDIACGIVKPTVSGIRGHLSCSQAKAAALRKQIVSSSL